MLQWAIQWSYRVYKIARFSAARLAASEYRSIWTSPKLSKFPFCKSSLRDKLQIASRMSAASHNQWEFPRFPRKLYFPARVWIELRFHFRRGVSYDEASALNTLFTSLAQFRFDYATWNTNPRCDCHSYDHSFMCMYISVHIYIQVWWNFRQFSHPSQEFASGKMGKVNRCLLGEYWTGERAKFRQDIGV